MLYVNRQLILNTHVTEVLYSSDSVRGVLRILDQPENPRSTDVEGPVMIIEISFERFQSLM